ncbi:MAG: hypothetical protein CMH21_13665 [Methylophaga sp.]|jgi:hypothetical protein|nr:hypothetical protein [Methylophaga sp.]MAY18768.1 hypothetical protein [Methylophaga sp.]HAO25741.1 hypothetical protein [Methylophaga sp.]HCD04441.1 hypothetical protein [Methylophaga sp.]|tara:strand:+ start:43599 stop:43778 length:180 start_codon:yes stop_codon:yes gene_type:complete
MMPTANRGIKESRPPTESELIKVWNLLLEYERDPNHKNDSLYAALRSVRGMAPAEGVGQ